MNYGVGWFLNNFFFLQNPPADTSNPFLVSIANQLSLKMHKHKYSIIDLHSILKLHKSSCVQTVDEVQCARVTDESAV